MAIRYHAIDPDGDLLLLLVQPLSRSTLTENTTPTTPNPSAARTTLLGGSQAAAFGAPAVSGQGAGSLFGRPAAPTGVSFGAPLTASSSGPSLFGTSSKPPSQAVQPTHVCQKAASSWSSPVHLNGEEPKNKVLRGDEIQMLVSSKVLSVASPVFKAMLGNDTFMEGQILHSKGKVSVNLSDDDPDAMKVLLDILHHRTRFVPNMISLGMMTHLTILVDKYQMVEVLGAYQQLWLTGETTLKRSFPATFDSNDFGPWLAICCVLQLPLKFRSITKLALQDSQAQLNGLTYDGHDLPISSSVIKEIEARRQDAIGRAVQIVQEAITRYSGPEVHCKNSPNGMSSTCDALQLGSLLKGASAIGIWPAPASPFVGLSWRSVSENFQKMAVPTRCQFNVAFGSLGAEHGVMPDIIRQAKHLDGLMDGIPLDPLYQNFRNRGRV